VEYLLITKQELLEVMDRSCQMSLQVVGLQLVYQEQALMDTCQAMVY